MNNNPKFQSWRTASLLASCFCLLALLAAAGASYLVYRETQVLADLQTEKSEVANQKDHLILLRSLTEEVRGGERKIADYFVSPRSLPQFLEDLEKLATVAGVGFEIASVTEGRQERPVVTLRGSAVGLFTRVYHFLELVDSMPHKIYFTQMILEQDSNQAGSENRWKADFTFELMSYDIKDGASN